MSSKHVRDTFRSWAATLATPFYDTVNKTVNPTEDIWCSVRFDAFDNEWQTLCNKEETGEIELMYFAQAGVGDSAVLTAIETDVPVILGKRDTPLEKFKVHGCGPVDDFGMPDANFRMSVRFDYSFYHTQGVSP